MEERLILKSRSRRNRFSRILLIACVSSILIGIVVSIIVYLTGEFYISGHSFYNPFLNGGSGGTSYIEDKYLPFKEEYTYFTFFISYLLSFDQKYGIFILASLVAFLVYLFNYFQTNKSSLILTNKRIKGRSSFGKRVDLPLSKISSLGLCSFSGIKIYTASGKIKFYLLDNREELYTAISDALTNFNHSNHLSSIENNSNAEELKKYKMLLDDGIITEEEFISKKKQLLGL